MILAAPYPADVRAKGWRFEIDYEKVEQSDTCALAAEVPMAQHALLMMWMVAWTQVPCGSMPNEPALIRAKCRVPQKMWAALEPVLMRGWWLAEDGRLYHNTIVERVREMLEYRRKEAERRNRNRGKPPAVPDLSRGTDAGLTTDTTGTPDTGTGTSSSLRSEEIPVEKYSAEFEAAWSRYPKRPGASKHDACKAWNARLKAGVTADVLIDGVGRYAAYCIACKTEPGFIKQPATFFGPGEHYLADWAAPPPAQRGACPANTHKYAAASKAIFEDDDERRTVNA